VVGKWFGEPVIIGVGRGDMAVDIDAKLFIDGLVHAPAGNFAVQVKLLLQPWLSKGIEAGIEAGGGLVMRAPQQCACIRKARTAQGINAPDEAIEVIGGQ